MSPCMTPFQSLGRTLHRAMFLCLKCLRVVVFTVFFLFLLLARSGEVAVLGTKSGRGNGVLCASLCDSLARSFRRCAARRLDPSGRR